MNCNEDNLSFKLEKFPNNGGQNETKNKNKILRKTGHCRIIYKNISNVTILSSSSQSVPNILECSITKQHVSRFTLCRPFFSLRIKQYIYIYIYLESISWKRGTELKKNIPSPSLSPPLSFWPCFDRRGTRRKGKERRAEEGRRKPRRDGEASGNRFGGVVNMCRPRPHMYPHIAAQLGL